jgi:hypothetical protein
MIHPAYFIAAPFVVSAAVLIACMVSEIRFQRRLARLTVGQVIAPPVASLRVVEEEPASTPAPVISIADYKRDWYPAA